MSTEEEKSPKSPERIPTREAEIRSGEESKKTTPKAPIREIEIRYGDIGGEEPETQTADKTGAGDLPDGPKPRPFLSDKELEKAARADDARLRGMDLGEIRFGSLGGGTSSGSARRPEPSKLDITALTSYLDSTKSGTGTTSRAELKLCRKYEQTIETLERGHWRELPADINPHELAATGWGVIFAEDEDPAVRSQLRPLLDLRKSQASDLYQEFVREPTDSASFFLWRKYGETPGVFEPGRLPYYILIVGDPKKIPFEFQYQLSVNHAVGRIAFDDVANYGHYARAVVEADRNGTNLPNHAEIFSVESDRETGLLAKHLAKPIRDDWSRLAKRWTLGAAIRGSEASKERLRRLLDTDGAPGLILISSHGERFAAGSADQRRYQGAPRCIDGHFYAEDVHPHARLDGQIVFLFSCYGAGTPVRDNFPQVLGDDDPKILTDEPFIAQLPQVLLSRGAMACVGHVDRGWTTSFVWVFGEEEVPAVLSLKDALLQLLRQGQRLGHAMRPLVRRYTALAATLALEIDVQNSYKEKDERASERLAFQWLAMNDARNFIILGDPAVYILGRTGSSIGQRRD